MSYVIYDPNTTRILRIMRNGYWQNAEYKTKGAAKAGLKREVFNLLDRHGISETELEIAESGMFHEQIEHWVPRFNLLTGKRFMQPINTPACCDPSTETYHSM